MSAGTCTHCGGDGRLLGIRCFRCKGTANYPPPRNPFTVWWRRALRNLDRALDQVGAL